MLAIVIAALAAGAVLLVSVGIAMSGGSGGVAARLERYARSGGTDAEGEGEKESAMMAGLTRVIERQDLTTRLSTDIARADLKLKPAEFVALWIASGIFLVQADQQAVVTRFGAVTERRVTPGIHYALPWPIDVVPLSTVTDASGLMRIAVVSGFTDV